MYADSDPDHTKSLIAFKLDQVPSDFFPGISNQLYWHNPASKQTNGHENNTSLVDSGGGNNTCTAFKVCGVKLVYVFIHAFIS